MLSRCVLVWVTVSSCLCAFGVPKGSVKQALQHLVRTPRVEFAPALEFHRRAGFVAFPLESMASAEAARMMKDEDDSDGHANSRAEDAWKRLEAARIHDAHGDVTGALRQYSRAVDGFRKRLEVSPEEVRSLAGLGDALGALGRFSEAESVLDRAGDVNDAQLWLARAMLYRERAWFAAVGEAQRFSASPFLDQLVSLVAFSLEPARVEESKRFLKRAEEAVVRAFEAETTTRAMQVDRLLQRAAFRSFQNAMETAYAQIQNVDLKSRLLRTSLFTEQAIHDLIAAAEVSDDPAVMAAAALAASMAGNVLAGWAPVSEGGEGSGAEAYVRQVATRLQKMIHVGGKNGAEAAEFLGCLQLQVFRDAQGAERSFRQALALERGRLRSWELLTQAAVQQGTEEFVKVAEERVTAFPQARSSVLQVKSHERMGDHLRGAWLALNAVGTYPNDWMVHLSLAAMLLKDENADMFLWRVDEALGKAEKALGRNPKRQERVDFVLVKSVFLGMSDKMDEAKRLIEATKPLTPELQEVMRALGE